jgi:hypothetical protein
MFFASKASFVEKTNPVTEDYQGKSKNKKPPTINVIVGEQ